MTTITQKILPIDTPNHNGRIYPREEVEKMIAKFNDRPKEHQLLGEIGVPGLDGLNISLDRVSHSVDELFIEENHVMAKITVLDTPMGKVLKTLCEEVPDKIKLGPRGMGVVSEDGEISRYTLITVDILTPN